MKNSIILWTLALLAGGLAACEELGISISETESVRDTATNEKLPDTVFVQQFVIPEGGHYSSRSSFEKLEADEIHFTALFDSTAVYQTSDPDNQGDINKLYGLSDCNGFHQKNSARFGWRWFNQRLEIFAYTYLNGVRNFKYIAPATLNTYHDYRITFEDERYVFSLDNITVELPRSCAKEASGYLLFPYFGGDESAPHDIRIEIRPEK